jgi:hypothetical protein
MKFDESLWGCLLHLVIEFARQSRQAGLCASDFADESGFDSLPITTHNPLTQKRITYSSLRAKYE